MIFDELWRLRRRRDRTLRRYDRWIHKARKKRDSDEEESLISEVIQERQLYNDDISSADGIKLRRQAEKFGLPVPEFSDKSAWEQGYNPAITYLNAAARTALRQAIRRERRERWDMVTLILKDFAAPIIAILVSIANVILALKLRR
jgi:hypothetical protein